MKRINVLGNFIDIALQKIESWVKYPLYADPNIQRKAEIIHTLAYMILLMALATISITPFVFNNTIYGVSITGGVLLFCLLILILNRLGKTGLAAQLFVIVIWAFDTGIVLLSGGMQSDFLVTYITITVMGGLILGNNAAYNLAGLSTFAFLFLYFLERQGILPEPLISFRPIALILINSVTIFLAAITLVMVILKYEEYFQEFTKNEVSLSSTNQKLSWEISARKEAETLLRQSEERLRSALMESPYPTMLHIIDGEILLVNTAWTQSSGYSLPELSTMDDWSDQIYREHKEEVEENISRLESGDETALESYLDLYTKQGDPLSWYLRWTRLPELPDGRNLILTIATDMTSLLSIESALRQSEENYSKYTLVTNDGLWDWDLTNNEVVYDPHYYTMAGYEVDEFPHRLEEFRKRVHPEDVERVFKAAEDHLQGDKEDYMVEFRFQKKEGGWLWIMARGKITEQDEFGNPLRFVGTHTDISAQKAIELQLFEHQQHLEQIVKERTKSLNERISEVERLNAALTNILDDYQTANEKLTAVSANLATTYQELESFTSSMSNDLQDPLQTIKKNADLLIDKSAKKLTAKHLTALQDIQTNATLVDQRISDLLKISLISRKDIHPTEVDTNLIAEKALRNYASEIENYNIKLDLKDLPACQADPELLEQVFHNLIGNAVKFSQNANQPEIKIGAQPAETSDKVVFFIRDNGIGFKMKDQDKVFQTFQSLHEDASYSGSGVGLTIANIIIHKHGGQIWAEAEQGTGATFFFELPLPPNRRNSKPEA